MISEQETKRLNFPGNFAALQDSAVDVSRALTLPPECYTSQEHYDFEVEAIFAREWVCVGRADQIPNPGDYFSVTVVNDPLVVVRGHDGEIRVLSSVCRHRAAVIVEGSGNCGTALTCPYHAWSYDLDGNLRGAPVMTRAEGFDRGGVKLPQVRVETWKGFVFVNFDPHAALLGPRLRDVEGLIANYRLEELSARPPATYEQPWNWKVMIENAMECYHCSFLHRGYHECAPTWNLLPPQLKHVEDVLIMRVRTTHPDAAFTPTERVMFPVIETLSDEDRNHFTWVNVLPNLILSCNADNVHYLLLLPHGPASITLQVGWCFPASTLAMPRFDDLFAMASMAWAPILEQDTMVNMRVQKGLKSRFAPRGRYSPYEEHLVMFNRWLVKRYRTALQAANGRPNGANGAAEV